MCNGIRKNPVFFLSFNKKIVPKYKELTIKSSKIFKCYLAVSPHSRHYRVNLLPLQTSVSHSQELVLNNKGKRSFVHINHNCNATMNSILSDKWGQTYGGICQEPRRPRLSWESWDMCRQPGSCRDKLCFSRGPSPRSVRCFRLKTINDNNVKDSNYLGPSLTW